MALTDVEVCTRALVRLGSGGIDSLTDGSDKATACAAIYTSILENELATYPWRFSMRKANLARLTDTPTNEWKYAFQLPSDRIGAPFAAFASNAVSARPMKEYEVFADKMFTNYATVYIDYPFKPSENMFPAYFTEFLVLALAGALAIPITDQANLAQIYDQKAYGTPSDGGHGGQLAKARQADSSQQPPQTFEDFSLVDARYQF